jgi:hypothetical protein
VKKLFAILLVFGVLTLTGCDIGDAFGTDPGDSDLSDVIPSTPQNVEIIDYDAPAMKVTVSINAELELTLSYAYDILEVNALNTDAQTLLAGMDLVGQPYESGITTILEKAREKGFLKESAQVAFSPKELASGGIKIHTGDMLLQPVWAYQRSSGVSFSARTEITGEMLDPNQLELVATHRDGTGKQEDYADKSGKIKKQVYTYADGLIRIQYHPNGPKNPPDMVCITTFPDGQYEYYAEKDGTMSGYIQYPDGGRETFIHIFKPGPGEWTNVYSRATYPDGTLTERFYKKGELYSALNVAPDGTKMESFFENEMVVRSMTYHPDGTITEDQWTYENGLETTHIQIHPNGKTTKEEFFYENGERSRVFITFPNGATQEQFWKNGEIVNVIDTYPDNSETDGIPIEPSYGTTEDGGTYTITYYPNGREKTHETTWPNGDYARVTYQENGQPSYNETLLDGMYEETHYDQNGNWASVLRRDQAGFEYNYQYEDGRCVVEVIKFPSGDIQRRDFSADGSYILSDATTNGNYSTHYYDAKHNCISASGLRDGVYWEQAFDENGQAISEHQRHPDGTEYQFDYENGALTGVTVTHPDGTSEYTPYS